MANKQPVDGEEINLFDVIDALWEGRVILAGFVVAAMALAAVILAFNKPEYVTKTIYEINPSPPFLEKNEIEADISRTFFNAKTFARWKAGSPGVSLNIDMIDPKEIIDGAVFRSFWEEGWYPLRVPTSK